MFWVEFYQHVDIAAGLELISQNRTKKCKLLDVMTLAKRLDFFVRNLNILS